MSKAFKVDKGLGLEEADVERGYEIWASSYDQMLDYLNTAVDVEFELLETQESYVPARWGKMSSTYRDVIGHPLGIGFRWGIRKQEIC